MRCFMNPTISKPKASTTSVFRNMLWSLMPHSKRCYMTQSIFNRKILTKSVKLAIGRGASVVRQLQETGTSAPPQWATPESANLQQLQGWHVQARENEDNHAKP